MRCPKVGQRRSFGIFGGVRLCLIIIYTVFGDT